MARESEESTTVMGIPGLKSRNEAISIIEIYIMELKTITRIHAWRKGGGQDLCSWPDEHGEGWGGADEGLEPNPRRDRPVEAFCQCSRLKEKEGEKNTRSWRRNEQLFVLPSVQDQGKAETL